MRINFGEAEYLGMGHVFQTPSRSREGLVHTTVILPTEHPDIFTSTCSCEGYRFTGSCRHLEAIGDPSELPRVYVEPPKSRKALEELLHRADNCIDMDAQYVEDVCRDALGLGDPFEGLSDDAT